MTPCHLMELSRVWAVNTPHKRATSEYLMDIVDGDKIFPVDASEYGNISRFLNHSRTPNVESYAPPERKRHVVLRTIRDIDVGEQLSYNYGKQYDGAFEGSDCSSTPWPASESCTPS